ncbi:hypothetical protein GGH99_000409 [Coemansia sp. RSA 1285]|nr:hypothetical protein GGH99_000409 [Coemansia sp. RSA 1285]
MLIPRPVQIMMLKQKQQQLFSKILVANRGEIACRIMRTARRLGIRTVAVYSDADADAQFVKQADEAYNVGPAPSAQSYLNIDAIMKAIGESGAQAVHPGYGFLSENAAFVRRLDAAGVAFIGPRERAMAAMGDKIQSKIIAKEAGVSTIPGFDGVVRDAEHAVEIAEGIGYPVMLKASAGGGGKGMRVARTAREVRDGFKLARDEAQSSFGDGRLLVERFIEEPRHIEIQIIADGHGNVLITGLDLVELMIQSAAGRALALQQADVAVRGWAIEARVYAEDPERYLPSIGALARYQEPAGWRKAGDVRCDSGVAEGSAISIHYDPMICKLSTHGATRADAIAAMCHALDRYLIKGVTHNIPLLRDVVASADFAAGRTSTSFLAEHYPHGFKGHRLTDQSAARLAAVSGALALIRQARDAKRSDAASADFAVLLPQLRDDGSVAKREAAVSVSLASGAHSIALDGTNEFRVATALDGAADPTVQTLRIRWAVDQPFVEIEDAESGSGSGSSSVVQFLDPLPLGFRLQFMGTKFDIDVLAPRQRDLMRFMKEKEAADTSRLVLAPMPGSIVSVAVAPGDIVAEGAEVAVVEAMKMQNVLRAPRAGTVRAVHVTPGATVSGDDVLVELEAE